MKLVLVINFLILCVCVCFTYFLGVLLYPVEWGVTKGGNPWVAVLISWFLVQVCV